MVVQVDKIFSLPNPLELYSDYFPGCWNQRGVSIRILLLG